MVSKFLVLTSLLAFLVLNFATIVITKPEDIRYEPNWDSLDTRPLPAWYDEAKVGIFIHWGVFSVPSFGSEWFWYNWKDNRTEYVEFIEKNYPVQFTYQEFAKEFTAEFFDATEWADLFAKSGAKYVVLTSKHHEGFTLWPSKYAYSWNSVDIGPHRDIVGELAEAVRAKGLTFGAYHSLLEWFHPLYLADAETNFTTTNYFATQKILPEMRELVEKYKISVLWSDGDWDAPDTYWKSTEFLAWLYNESPVKDEVVVNDRWGIDIPCHHGDFYSCQDRYDPGTLQPHKWENAMTVDRESWGFRRNAKLKDYLSISELLSTLASTVSCGGNLLMNIGPTSAGIISPIYEERLLQMGEWLGINGEAIYGARPWTVQNDTIAKGVWYTSKGGTVYAIVLHWAPFVVLGSPVEFFQDNNPSVWLVGNEANGPLKWYIGTGVVNAVYVATPDKAVVKSQWAWVLKIEPNSNNV